MERELIRLRICPRRLTVELIYVNTRPNNCRVVLSTQSSTILDCDSEALREGTAVPRIDNKKLVKDLLKIDKEFQDREKKQKTAAPF